MSVAVGAMLPGWLIGTAVLITVLLGVATTANADDAYPLRGPDTSSPRATLQGFITTADDIYRSMQGVMQGYARSDRLYLTAEERQQQLATLRKAPTLFRYLDLSHIPPALLEIVAAERVLQLKEVLDRIDIPPFADIPDQGATAGQPLKRWRLPNTEIDIVRIESGPRAGEFLVDTATIDRLPEFYARIRDLPYKPGAGEQLSALYSTLSNSGSRVTIYDAFMSSPIGLSYVVPPRWMLDLPDWAKLRYAGATPWQWLGLVLVLLVGALIIWLSHRIARPRADAVEARLRWHALLLPLAIMFVAGVLVPRADTMLRIGDMPRTIIEYARTVALYLGGAWLAIVAAAELGEAIIGSERLTIRSLDDQLIRLGVRLVGILAAAVILIEGGDELGFPAFSVLAGLGVGGLAVALAAQSTIANLIGSLLIALEKPFRVGQSVRIGATEGTVEDVGFRSTRIRTPDSSIVSIPSSTVVSSTVENLSVRTRRRQRLVVQVSDDTPRGKLETLMEGIRQLLAGNPHVEPDTYQVRLNNFAEDSLEVLVVFHLLVKDTSTELAEREAVLLRIMELRTG
ncbi:MAG TPA: mechanosensitive ion channel family protein [Acetobacteraceae bacterium]|jgi:MscS family membrane protein|nr:mechanosensitive ion channel family protein [Acetobacteraceae bacterium]